MKGLLKRIAVVLLIIPWAILITLPSLLICMLFDAAYWLATGRDLESMYKAPKWVHSIGGLVDD